MKSAQQHSPEWQANEYDLAEIQQGWQLGIRRTVVRGRRHAPMACGGAAAGNGAKKRAGNLWRRNSRSGENIHHRYEIFLGIGSLDGAA